MSNLTITNVNDPRAYVPQYLKAWIKEAQENEFKYLVVVCDTFSDEEILRFDPSLGDPPGCDYPVFARDDEEMNEAVLEFNDKNMQTIQGIYQVRDDLGGMRTLIDPNVLPIICLICGEEGLIEDHAHLIPPEEDD